MNSRLVGRWPGRVVLFAFLGGGAVLWFTLAHLGVDTDTSGMIPPPPNLERNIQKFKEAFPKQDKNLVIVLTANTPEAAYGAAAKLEARLREETAVFKTVYAPAGGDFFRKNGLLFFSPDDLEELSNSVAKAQPFLSRLSTDPTLRGLFSLLSGAVEAVGKGEKFDLSPVLNRIETTTSSWLDGGSAPLSWQEVMNGGNGLVDEHYQFLMVQPILDKRQTLPVEPALKTIRRLGRELQTDPAEGVRVRITGEEALGYEEILAVFHSLGLVSSLSILLVLAILLAALRSFRLVSAIFVTLVLGLIMTAGFAAVAIGHLNMISVAFAVYYIGLGVTHSLHVCLRYRELMLEGNSSERALREAVADTAPGLILCAMTTAIGFFAFVGTAYAGVSELGIISGVGMFLSVALSLTVLPALVTLFPVKVRVGTGSSAATRLRDSVNGALARNARLVRWTALGLGAASLALIPKVKFDYNPLNLRDPNSESVSTLKEVVSLKNAGPEFSIDSLASSEEDAVEKAKRLSELKSVDHVMTVRNYIPTDQENKLKVIEDLGLMLGPPLAEAQPEMDPPFQDQLGAITDYLSKMQDYLKGTLTETERTAATRLRNTLKALTEKLKAWPDQEKTDRLMKLQHDLLGLLPFSLQNLSTALEAKGVGAQDLPPDLLERWISPDHEYRIEVYPKEDLNDPTAMRRFVKEVSGVLPNISGSAIEFLTLGSGVIRAFQQASGLALTAILILLLIVFRSFRDAMLVMIPVLLAGVLAAGATVILRVPFNFANVIALPLLLGVGVDNGVHIVRKMRKETVTGAVAERASVSAGVFYSALTTLAAFVNLSLATHEGMASLGRIHAISVSMGLICVLVVLPALAQGVMRPKPVAES